MKSVNFLSFADSRHEEALIRLKKQADKMSLFDDVYLLNENDLDIAVKNRINNIIETRGVRGYGYWVWKPRIILDKILQISDGDLLLYLDAGCHLNYLGKRYLEGYINELKESASDDLMVFQQASPHFNEANWCKGDVLDFFNIRNCTKILSSGQILSGIILIKKTEKSIELLKKWCNIMDSNFHLVDDTPSFTANLAEFQQNRHDQSIFSILCKFHNVIIKPSSEVEGEEAIILNQPILAIRDFGGRMPYRSYLLLWVTRVAKNPLLSFKILRRKLLHRTKLK